jgi:hypothetical protein
MISRFLPILILFFASALPNTSALGQAGEIVLNIEPSEAFPRNSEGSFVQLKSGRIVFYYTQFYGGKGDHSDARIAGIYSDDLGKTWSAPKPVVEKASGLNVMSVTLLRLASGKLAFFYLVKESMGDCRPHVRFSTDEAETWSEPTLMISAPGYFVLNNDRVIQLNSGRLVAPVAQHRIASANPSAAKPKTWDGRAIALWYLSDDEGKTWREATTWWALPVHSGSGLQEPGVVELEGGRLFGWARTDQGVQYGFNSTDGGENWTAPYPTKLASPNSPTSIKRLPGSTDLLAIYNDHSGRYPFTERRRTPFCSAVSKDGGSTWSPSKIIENDPEAGFCYTAMYFVKDNVLLGYCAGDFKTGQLNRLRIRRLPITQATAP